jgi:hypothetical protein
VTVILIGSEPAKPDSQLPMTQHQGASVENNKDPNQKKPGEKEPGTFHYNPGNMSGKTTGRTKIGRSNPTPTKQTIQTTSTNS